jgi:hypothetical protein
MANNDFLPWATGGGANVLSPAQYAALAERITGSVAGTAISADWNTAMRQSSFIVSAIALWIANNGISANDDGVLANMSGNLNGLIRGGLIASIAALRARLKTGSPSVFVLGYNSAGDGGGGEYHYDSTDVVSTDNGGTIIVAADGGRWKLNVGGFITPEQFGATGNGTTDDTAAINNCFAAVAAFVNQNTGDTTQRRRYFPILCTKAYKITSQVTVPAGVMVACEGGIFINALASTTTFCLIFSPGSHSFRLDINAMGGSGVQFGSAGSYCDMIIGTARVIGVGTGTSIVGCRVVGARFEIEDIEVDGGFVGIDFGDGTTNGARLVNIDSLKSTLPATGVRFGSNCEHVNLPNVLIDTPTTTGLTIDGSHAIRIRGIIFGDDTRAVTPCSSGYAAILGNTSALSDIDCDLTVNNTASLDATTGTAAKISNCSQSNININASRAPLTTGNAHRLAKCIEYGAGTGLGLNVTYNADPNLVPVVGTPVGVSSTPVIGAFRNLQASASGIGANISITADELCLENAGNNYQTVRGINLTIAGTSNGANGLDTGSLLASNWYSLWVIWNGTTAAGLMSLSASAPAMPAGYSHKARVGWVRTDSSVNKYPLSFKQSGRTVQYVVAAGSNVPNYPLIVSGVQGNTGTPTYVAASISNFVPTTAGKIKVISNTESTGTTMVSPNNSTGSAASTTNPPPISQGQAAGGYGTAMAELVLESTNIYYASNGGGTGVFCVGWEDS